MKTQLSRLIMISSLVFCFWNLGLFPTKKKEEKKTWILNQNLKMKTRKLVLVFENTVR